MLYDFKKAFLLFSFLKILLNNNINLVNLPGIPLLTMELVCNICFALYFFTVNKHLNKPASFPLLKAYFIVFSSLVCSTIFSTVPLGSAFTRTLQTICNDLIFVYILWNVLTTIKNLRFLLYGFVAVFLFLTLYGFFEKLTGLNPIRDYTVGLNSGGAQVIEWSYSDDGRLGMGRVQSAIIHPIGLGILLAGLLYILLSVSLRYEKILKFNSIEMLVILFLGICVLFFTNSRSPLVFLAIIFVPLFNLQEKYTYQLLVLGLMIFVLAFPYVSGYIENITSIFGKSGTTDNVGGSSIDMRFRQFTAAFNLIKGHYVFGLGIKSLQNLYGDETGILGAESIWIQLLVERGFFGVVSHIVFLVSVFKLGARKNKLQIGFFTLGWLVLTSITSTPGCGTAFFMTVVILLFKVDFLQFQNYIRTQKYENRKKTEYINCNCMHEQSQESLSLPR